MVKKEMRIAVTGGSGNIAYSVLFRLASGEVFGKDVAVSLCIVEVPELVPSLEGVKMELLDCAFPTLQDIQIGSDPQELFKEIDLALLIGAKPRGAGMERRDLLLENAKIFVQQGSALNAVATPETKVLVVGNPCNTNAWIAMNKATKIPKNQFFAMTMLDQNRAASLLAQKASVSLEEVSNVTIWGNHSTTQVPDAYNALIRGQKAEDVICDPEWIETTFMESVQKRGAEVIKARGKSSAASAANAIIDSVKALYTPTPAGTWYSLAMLSDKNPYGIRDNLIYSFPCKTTKSGEQQIVTGLHLPKQLEEKLHSTEKELIEEQNQVAGFVRV